MSANNGESTSTPTPPPTQQVVKDHISLLHSSLHQTRISKEGFTTKRSVEAAGISPPKSSLPSKRVNPGAPMDPTDEVNLSSIAESTMEVEDELFGLLSSISNSCDKESRSIPSILDGKIDSFKSKVGFCIGSIFEKIKLISEALQKINAKCNDSILTASSPQPPPPIP